MVTPESRSVNEVFPANMKQAMALVSPTDSPVHSSHPIHNVPDLEPPILQGRLEPPMDSFEGDVQALLSVDSLFSDEEMAINESAAYMNNNQDFSSDYSLDPLFLLDEVASIGH